MHENEHVMHAERVFPRNPGESLQDYSLRLTEAGQIVCGIDQELEEVGVLPPAALKDFLEKHPEDRKEMMICQKCKNEVSQSAVLCPFCDAELTIPVAIKAPREITFDWLRAVLAPEGYSFENVDENTLFAKRSKEGTIMFKILQKSSVITIATLIRIKKPSWTKKTEFLEALNLANAIQWVCNLTAEPPYDCLFVSTFIYMPEGISTGSFINFLTLFDGAITSALNESGLMRFS